MAEKFLRDIQESNKRAIASAQHLQMSEGELIEIDDTASIGVVELFEEYGNRINLTGIIVSGNPFNRETMVWWKPVVREYQLNINGERDIGAPPLAGERCLVLWPRPSSVPYIIVGARVGVYFDAAYILGNHLTKYDNLGRTNLVNILNDFGYIVSINQDRNNQTKHILMAVEGEGEQSYIRVTERVHKVSVPNKGTGRFNLTDDKGYGNANIEVPLPVPHAGSIDFDSEKNSDFIHTDNNRFYMASDTQLSYLNDITVKTADSEAPTGGWGDIDASVKSPSEVIPGNSVYTVKIPSNHTWVRIELSLNELLLSSADFGGSPSNFQDIRELNTLISPISIRIINPTDYTPSINDLNSTSGSSITFGLAQGGSMPTDVDSRVWRFLIVRGRRIESIYDVSIVRE